MECDTREEASGAIASVLFSLFYRLSPERLVCPRSLRFRRKNLCTTNIVSLPCFWAVDLKHGYSTRPSTSTSTPPSRALQRRRIPPLHKPRIPIPRTPIHPNTLQRLPPIRAPGSHSFLNQCAVFQSLTMPASVVRSPRQYGTACSAAGSPVLGLLAVVVVEHCAI